MDITATTAGLAIASGAIVGALLALFGGGGSVLATPLLLYVVGVRDPHVAIGTSAAAVAFNAASNLLGHCGAASLAGLARRPDPLLLGSSWKAGRMQAVVLADRDCPR